MLKFTKVKLHNFLSYKEATLDLDNQGVTLIEGENKSNDSYTSSGSGKSSLLSAITYAIYGKTVTGLTSNAVINKEVGTDCSVVLYFIIDKDKYCIKRFRKGKHGAGNKVRLYLNDHEITEATNPKTDKAILDLIGIQFNTYVNTISYGSSDEPVFSQATDKGKKEILDNLANTSIYSKARTYASDKLKEYKFEQSKEETIIDNAQTAINQFKELEKQDRERYEEEEKRKKVNKSSLELAKLDRDNYAKESLKRLKELNIAYDELLKKEPKLDIANELTTAKAELNKTNTSLNKIQQLWTKNASLLSSLSIQYKDLFNKTVCPVCDRPLDKEHKKSELNNLITKANGYKEKIKKYNTLKVKLKALQTKQENELTILQQKQSNYNNEYKLYISNINKVKDEIAKINNRQKENDLRVTTLESHTGIDIIPAKCYTKYIKIEEEKLTNSEKKLKVLRTKIDNYTVLVNKVFSKEGITSVVLDLITPYLNEHANYYLNKLSGSILSINMNTQTLNANNTLSDKFDLQVRNQAGADSYQNCSAGERKRIDIAISFAIQDLQQEHSNTATNIAIYDECFDGLDSVGCESVIDILKEKSKIIPSIFVITHNETLKPLFDNSIKVIKDKQGISTIGV